MDSSLFGVCNTGDDDKHLLANVLYTDRSRVPKTFSETRAGWEKRYVEGDVILTKIKTASTGAVYVFKVKQSVNIPLFVVPHKIAVLQPGEYPVAHAYENILSSPSMSLHAFIFEGYAANLLALSLMTYCGREHKHKTNLPRLILQLDHDAAEEARHFTETLDQLVKTDRAFKALAGSISLPKFFELPSKLWNKKPLNGGSTDTSSLIQTFVMPAIQSTVEHVLRKHQVALARAYLNTAMDQGLVATRAAYYPMHWKMVVAAVRPVKYSIFDLPPDAVIRPVFPTTAAKMDIRALYDTDVPVNPFQNMEMYYAEYVRKNIDPRLPDQVRAFYSNYRLSDIIRSFPALAPPDEYHLRTVGAEIKSGPRGCQVRLPIIDVDLVNPESVQAARNLLFLRAADTELILTGGARVEETPFDVLNYLKRVFSSNIKRTNSIRIPIGANSAPREEIANNFVIYAELDHGGLERVPL